MCLWVRFLLDRGFRFRAWHCMSRLPIVCGDVRENAHQLVHGFTELHGILFNAIPGCPCMHLYTRKDERHISHWLFPGFPVSGLEKASHFNGRIGKLQSQTAGRWEARAYSPGSVPSLSEVIVSFLWYMSPLLWGIPPSCYPRP